MDHLRKLPDYCYSNFEGRVMVIKKLAREPIPAKIADPNLVDTMNNMIGVSVAQRLAMEKGIAFGWTDPRCDPDPDAKLAPYEVVLPVLVTRTVMAYSEEDAINQAGLELPEGFTVDGSASAEAVKFSQEMGDEL